MNGPRSGAALRAGALAAAGAAVAVPAYVVLVPDGLGPALGGDSAWGRASGAVGLIGFILACSIVSLIRRGSRLGLLVAASSVVAAASLALGSRWEGGLGVAAVFGGCGLAAGLARCLIPGMAVDGTARADAVLLACGAGFAGVGGVAAFVLARLTDGSGATGRTGAWLAALVVGAAVMGAAARWRARAGNDTCTGAPAPAGGGVVGAERLARWLAVPALRGLLFWQGVLGAVMVAAPRLLWQLAGERFDLSLSDRHRLAGWVLLGSVVPLGLAAARFGRAAGSTGDRPGEPREHLEGAVWPFVGVAVALVAAATAPVVPVAVVAVVAAVVGLAVGLVAFERAAMAVIEPAARSGFAAAMGTYAVGAGGFAGLVVFGGLEHRYGAGVALGGLAVPVLAATLATRALLPLVRTAGQEFLRRRDEEEALERDLRAGQAPPLLAVRGVDFSYGPVQVLFDVSFTVDEGEMVALLGTNGAGKSTLLRVISGLGSPQRGSVRLRGRDMTYMGPGDRLGLGVLQVPGGRGVYPALTVAENLRIFRERSRSGGVRAEDGLDEVFLTFPTLAAKRNQAARTLSGGEQQMLALSRILFSRPSLLLIDELSLGLAPVVVADLLQLVRKVNAQGTAVVLVEQSVNIALSLAERAYFMERGTVTYEGPAGALLDAPGVVGSVFLEGAAAMLGRSGGEPAPGGSAAV